MTGRDATPCALNTIAHMLAWRCGRDCLALMEKESTRHQSWRPRARNQTASASACAICENRNDAAASGTENLYIWNQREDAHRVSRGAHFPFAASVGSRGIIRRIVEGRIQ